MNQFALQIIDSTPAGVGHPCSAGGARRAAASCADYPPPCGPDRAGRFPLRRLSWQQAVVRLVCCLAASLLAAAAFTFFVWKPTAGARHDAAIDRLRVPGSVVPMLLMLTIFCSITRSTLAWPSIPRCAASWSCRSGRQWCLGCCRVSSPDARLHCSA